MAELDIEMADTARAIVDTCLDVRPDEEVLVITDARRLNVGRAIATASKAAGATTTLAIMPLLESHGNEPPPVIAEGMRTADVAFTCTTYAITHTKARTAAFEAGTRTGSLREVTEDMMIEGAMTVDFEMLRTVTNAVRDRLQVAKEGRVVSKPGTDISFSLDGADAFALNGFYSEVHGFATLPPGEAPTRPIEGTANGTVVFDVSMDNIGWLDDPIELTVEDGWVTGVAGGAEAAQLQRIFDENDENARNLAEVAIGTNWNARLIGNIAEDKKANGTVHLAVGDNVSLGGDVRSEIHLDGVIERPTVYLDGEIVVEDGELGRQFYPD